MIQLPQATILSQPMNRAEFLRHAGVGVVLLLGGGTIARGLGVNLPAQNQQGASFGGNAYGGAQKLS